MKATTLWVVFTLFIVIYQASALPLAPHKEAEDVKSADVPKQEDKDIKEDEKEQGSDNKDEEEEESSADEEEQPDEEVDSESNGSASADKPEESEEKERRSVEESGESPKGASDKKSKAVAGIFHCHFLNHNILPFFLYFLYFPFGKKNLNKIVLDILSSYYVITLIKL